MNKKIIDIVFLQYFMHIFIKLILLMKIYRDLKDLVFY